MYIKPRSPCQVYCKIYLEDNYLRSAPSISHIMAPPAAKTTEDIAPGINLDEVPPFWKRKNGMLLYFLLTSSFFSSLASGFDGVWLIMTTYTALTDTFDSP